MKTKKLVNKTFSELVFNSLHLKRIEPIPRVKDIDHVPRGFRNLKPEPRYIWHTYPIKGGIDGYQLYAESIAGNNQLLKLLKSRL